MAQEGGVIMATCGRCGKVTAARFGSMFDKSMICIDCKTAERDHPDHRRAREAEERAVRSGDMNFPGVGWPGPASQATEGTPEEKSGEIPGFIQG